MRLTLLLCSLAVLALSGFALAHLESGLDYFGDAGGPIDWLVRGNLDAFFANQPLMGPLSLLVRAPFVALVFSADEPTVYMAGVIPCFAALGALGIWLSRRMEADGRPVPERVAVLVACLASPFVVRAIHWGHPEELLCAAAAVAGVLAAGRGRPVWAGALIGLAVATKQWAVLAALPALLATRQPLRLAGVAAAVAALFYVPMLVGDPDRFFDVVRAASSTEPAEVLGLHVAADLPGSRVTPTNVWWPFAETYTLELGRLYRQPEGLGRLTHSLILVAALPLAAAAWWRRGRPLDALDALRLLALIMAVRGLLDPMSLDYYHLVVVVALAAAGAVGSRADALAAVAATAALGLVFAAPATGMYDISADALAKNLGYLTAMAALLAWLSRTLLGPIASPGWRSPRSTAPSR